MKNDKIIKNSGNHLRRLCLSLVFLLGTLAAYSQLHLFTIDEGNYFIPKIGAGNFTVSRGTITDFGNLDVINNNGKIIVSNVVAKEDAFLFSLSNSEVQLLEGFEVRPDAGAEVWVGSEFFTCSAAAVARMENTAETSDRETAVNPKTEEWGSSITVYPNPSSKEFYFMYPSVMSTQVNLQIIDLQGKVLESKVLEAMPSGEYNRVLYDGSQLKPGVYRYRLIIGGKQLKDGMLVKE